MYYSMSRLSSIDVKWADLFNANANPSFLDKHYNPYYELIVAAEGTVNLEAGGVRNVLEAGDSLLLSPWEQHHGWSVKEPQGKFYWAQFACSPGLDKFNTTSATELHIVHAERTELRTIEFGHEDMLIVPRLHRNRQRYKLLSRFEDLVDTMRHPRGYFRFQSTLMIADMLGLIANDFLEQSHLDTAFPISYFTFRKLVDHLNNFYESDISRKKLEQTLDYKYEYLCQVFKKYAGISILRYIQQLRMQRAKYLLHHTGKSVQDISQEVGYPDPFYFSRLFKKLEGVAPQHYRDANTKHH
ncbi:AraC family transcriptional regulator [Paenibacillus whitsoniae]|uniref:AraC family transcriptional regulator n=1 Tax=Paenibacillus whitsoniae TaxID=2496558 RepID=A0A430JIG7_9BACL|nr:AraC family transcriptional regulator [Paenibacillus whitsoniae]RTE10810.1 AraC family transcriptional regulator [Paenibacillus whitsoniae]